MIKIINNGYLTNLITMDRSWFLCVIDSEYLKKIGIKIK